MMRVMLTLALVAGAAVAISCGADKKAPPTASVAVPAPTTTSAATASSQTAGDWSDGQRVLIQGSDLSGFPNKTSAFEIWRGDGGFFKLFQACDESDQLVEQIGPDGPDVAPGDAFSQGPANVEGGEGIASLALRGRDDAIATRAQALLSSTAFWDCAADQFVSEVHAFGGTARKAGVTLLPSADQEGLSVAIQTDVDRTTTDASHTPFTDHTDWVVVRVGNNIALLLLDDNDHPFPERLRIQLTLLTEQRLKALSP